MFAIRQCTGWDLTIINQKACPNIRRKPREGDKKSATYARSLTPFFTYFRRNIDILHTWCPCAPLLFKGSSTLFPLKLFLGDQRKRTPAVTLRMRFVSVSIWFPLRPRVWEIRSYRRRTRLGVYAFPHSRPTPHDTSIRPVAQAGTTLLHRRVYVLCPLTCFTHLLRITMVDALQWLTHYSGRPSAMVDALQCLTHCNYRRIVICWRIEIIDALQWLMNCNDWRIAMVDALQ